MDAESFKELIGVLTARELAIKMGVSERTIANWRKDGCPARQDIKVRRAVRALTKE